MRELIRGAFVIARRDFAATVLSRTFLFFLLGPLFPVLLGGLFGGIGARVAMNAQQPTIAVLAAPADFAAIAQAREQVAQSLGGGIRLKRFDPMGTEAQSIDQLLNSKQPPILAVLTGGVERPRLIGGVAATDPAVRELKLILAVARAGAPAETVDLPVTTTARASGSLNRDRALTAQISQMLLFFLTILLSGMLLSQLIEEKSNKIIEVIAAAVPIHAMFVGKLFAMLAASLLGIIVWVSAGAAAIAVLSEGGLASLAEPAVGWPTFLTLVSIYFAMNYLLLGAVFLSIGAQASTVREVQTLSMPVTFAQVAIFGFASVAVSNPNSSMAAAAAVFPLSSPLVMAARAAELPGLAAHCVAILWQSLWVGLILWGGARIFRRTVLKSGPGQGLFRRRTRPARG